MRGPVYDPGLQPERTSLSWVRTSTSIGVVALLLIRWYPTHGPMVFVPASVAFIVAGLLRFASRSSYRDGVAGVRADVIRKRTPKPRAEVPPAGTAASPGWVMVLCLAVVVLGLTALWAVLPGT